ncbi:MAG: 3-methylornithine--L-lysine ligase PylC [Anaerovoracaceae bacterium]
MKQKKITIIGGKLQGLEAAYLGMKAGYHLTLIDKNPNCIARDMVDVFFPEDIFDLSEAAITGLAEADFVLPAMENDQVLAELKRLSETSLRKMNIAFDFTAYKISSSKQASDKLFAEMAVPAPAYYPNCKPPYIVKPDFGSGSEGVIKIKSEKELTGYLIAKNNSLDNSDDIISSCINKYIIQEYYEGASFSIEVIGKPGNYKTYTITQIHMDELYDCKRVTCPCVFNSEETSLTEDEMYIDQISCEREKEMREITVKIAEKLKLKGIMDLEIIDTKDGIKVLEIDARFPSQTPTAVYKSTGINMIEELWNLFCHVK